MTTFNLDMGSIIDEWQSCINFKDDFYSVTQTKMTKNTHNEYTAHLH